jgi:hypothetical protein
MSSIEQIVSSQPVNFFPVGLIASVEERLQ